MANPGQQLIIRHMGERRFVVSRLEDGKSSNEVELTAPETVLVDGRPSSHLLHDLRWYLERFLDYPFEPHTDVAERIQRALAKWGQSTFEQLFNGQPLLWYDRIRQTGLDNLVLKIASDDPGILAWPWEALCDPHGTTLAHTCRLERQLSKLHDPLPLPEGLSETQINILLVIARPYGDDDVGFHAVSGPLVDWVRTERVPVQIDVLRPPTFTALQERLAARPGHYHIVHFDGHGGYGAADPPPSKYEFSGVQGHLIFEDADGNAHTVPAHKLTTLLGEYRIPIMVLNACQSARIDAQAEDPFASTAAALLKAGIRSVVAMGYNLYVSGAQQFVPAFYQRLLQSGDVAEATRAGRKAMLEHDARSCARGEYPLQDWLVPVLYQQGAVALSVRSAAQADAQTPQLPDEARSLGDYGFIGRQNAIHKLERALLRQPAAAVLIHGMAGVGKTTLAKGFLHWLQHTGGLGVADGGKAEGAPFVGAMWFAFDDIRSAEFVVNRLVTAYFGHDATSLPMEQRLPALAQALREHPLLIVWDNFESAAGIEGTEVSPALTEADRTFLKDLLKQLRGGRSKILITSRSPESWLAATEAFRLPLHGLRGEDAWAYCNAVVRDLGLQLDRSDKDVLELLKELDGHPLALRSVLLKLAEAPARELLNQFRHQFAGHGGDESTRRIFAALALLDRGLPERFAPILQLVGLHRRHVDIDYLARMMEEAREDEEQEPLHSCFATLERGGLIHHIGDGVYGMHPALPGFLAASHPADEAGIARFVNLMAAYADYLAHRELSEQRTAFAVHGANFQAASTLAARRGDADAIAAITQSLATFALNARDLSSAAHLCEMLAVGLTSADPKWQASACHHLGRFAEERRDYAVAEDWYRKSLAIAAEHGNEHSASICHHHLGMIAGRRRDFAAAERSYLESLAIKEKLGNEHGASITYHQLGRIAEEQRDFAAAESWHLKSLAVTEKNGDQEGALMTYNQLGKLAQERRDFAAAESWYRKSFAGSEKLGSDFGMAVSSHNLGNVALEQDDLAAAEHWFHRSLEIEEKRGNEDGAAITYHSLGIIAKGQGDFATAERWHLKSLAIWERYGNEHSAATAHHHLGLLAKVQGNLAAAEQWHLKSLAVNEKQGDEHGAGLTYGALGDLALEHDDFEGAGKRFLDSIQALGKANSEYHLAISVRRFVYCVRCADAQAGTRLREIWQKAGLDQLAELAELEREFRE